YLDQIAWVRAACPDIALSTDIIVGYPGETAEDFAETISLLEQVRYHSIYSFEYSPRPDTPALKLRLRDDVSIEAKAGRLQQLQALQARIRAGQAEALVGGTVEVLVEGEATRGEGRLCGRAPGNEMVNFGIEDHRSPAALPATLIGATVAVEITARRAHTLSGTLAAVIEPST